MAPEKRSYHTLDGMRGVAALLVVIFHFDTVFNYKPQAHSYLAVDLFFALSGFVLAHAYGRKLSQGLGLWGFLKIRFIRLYPLYFLGTAIGVANWWATLAYHHGRLGAAVLAGIALIGLPSSSPLHPSANLYPMNLPAWSLFFEIGVNVLMVLLWKRLSGRLLIGLICASFIGMIVALALNPAATLGWAWDGFPLGCMRVVFSFFVGVAIHRWRDRLRLPKTSPWLIVAATVLLLSIPTPPGLFWQVAYDFPALLIAVPLLVALGAQTEPESRTAATFKFAGLISYGVYVLHYPLVDRLHGAVTPSNRLALEGGFLVVLIVAIWLIDRFYDQPIRSALGRTFPNRPKAAFAT